MKSKISLDLIFDIKASIVIKTIDFHPVKNWLCYSSSNFLCTIWDYKYKFCYKAVNVQSFEPQIDGQQQSQKQLEIKNLFFLDKDVILWQSTCRDLSNVEALENFCNSNEIIQDSLVIVCDQKIFFYNYITDQVDYISNQILENKSIINAFLINHQYLGIIMQDGIINILYLIKHQSQWKIVSTLKMIKSIIYSQVFKHHSDQKPKLIIYCKEDQLACYNLDSDNAIYKYTMQKKGKQVQFIKSQFLKQQLTSANDGEELTCMIYDQIEFKLITVSESYITIWSSLSGQELKRYKNHRILLLVNLIHAFNSIQGFSKNTYIGSAKNNELFIFNLDFENKKEQDNVVDFKLLCDLKTKPDLEKQIQILFLKIHHLKPYLLVIGTTQGIYLFSINQYEIPQICFHINFQQKISIPEALEIFSEKGTIKQSCENKIQSALEKESISNEVKLPNFLFLIIKDNKFYAYLNDFTQVCNGSRPMIKSIIYQFNEEMNWDESNIKCSVSGKFISVINNGFYKIFKINNKHLMNFQNKNNILLKYQENAINNLNLFSHLLIIQEGYAKQIEWGKDADEIYILAGVDSQNMNVRYVEKIKNITKRKNFFTSKTIEIKSYELNKPCAKFVLQKYQYNEEKEVFQVVESENSQNIEKLFPGNIMAISQIVEDKKNFKQNVEKLSFLPNQLQVMITPLNIFWSPCGTIFIAVYSYFFQIFIHINGYIQFLREENESIYEGFFWGKLFFYVTFENISALLLNNYENVINIKIASLNASSRKMNQLKKNDSQLITYDSCTPFLQQMPFGQLKILTIFDFQLIVINQLLELYALKLDIHPIFNFCLFLQQEQTSKLCVEFASNFSSSNQETFFPFIKPFLTQELLQSYNQISKYDKFLLQILQDNDQTKQQNLIKNFILEIIQKFSNSKQYIKEVITLLQENQKLLIVQEILNILKQQGGDWHFLVQEIIKTKNEFSEFLIYQYKYT